MEQGNRSTYSVRGNRQMKCHIAPLYWFIGIIIFCVDRITKNIALALFSERTYSYIPGLSYETVVNRGISWGMFHSSESIFFVIISLMVMLITGSVVWYAYQQYAHGKAIFGYVCIIAGSLSNILDRLCYHGVIDFIIVSLGDYSWPVFNIADLAIVVGVGIITYPSIRSSLLR